MDFDQDPETARQARIAARRARVSARDAALATTQTAGGEQDGSPAGPSEDQLSLQSSSALQQLVASTAMLDEKKLRTIADVTDVRIQANVRELARRGAEEKRRTAREARLKEESLTAAKANAAAVMRWADLLERQLPQELASELASQQVACNAVLASKAAILARLEGDLAAKEEEFASVLAAQKADVAALLERMQAQFVEMRDGYEVGLTEVEAAFSAERAALAAANKKEIDAAFDARRSLEAKYVEDRLTKEETWATELYDTQSVDAENYARLKAKLETDVSILEQQLEHMKFTYLLNVEKLEYNYRVLSERDSENKNNLSTQKARLARLRSALSKVQSEYETQDAKYKARNNALTSEYQRLTRQYRELQDSSRVVAAGDAAVYSEVASVHEAEMTAMTERLRVADKVITEQLLGYAWAPPAGAGEAEAGFPSVQQTEVATDGDGEAEAVAAPVLDPSRLLPLLRLLTTDAGAFLIESAVQASCDNLDKAGKRDKAEALQGDAVLRAVGATTPAAVASLVEWFEAALQAGGSTTGLLSDRRDGQPALPLGFSTVLTVKGWMTQRKAAAEAAGGKVALNETADVLARLSEASGTLGGAGATSSAPRSLAARLKAKEKEEQAKWDALLATVPPTTLRTWTSLEGAMGKYRGVVTKRAALVGEVSSLTQANQEVRALLAMYLAAPSAAGLQVPPTATMMLGPNTAALALTVGGAMTPAEALGVRPEALAVAQMGLTGAGEKL